jgi:Uma2 family endonuclease
VSSSVLGGELMGPFQRGRGGPGGWWILDEPELHLGPDVLVPDLAGWRRERMPAMPEKAWFELIPDWACEVLSPSTAIIDRTRKLHIYARNRLEWLWFVDPGARTVEVLRLMDRDWIVAHTAGGDEKVRLPPFEAIELELDALWLPTPPPA